MTDDPDRKRMSPVRFGPCAGLLVSCLTQTLLEALLTARSGGVVLHLRDQPKMIADAIIERYADSIMNGQQGERMLT